LQHPKVCKVGKLPPKASRTVGPPPLSLVVEMPSSAQNRFNDASLQPLVAARLANSSAMQSRSRR
jgi:hypothetical protein